MDCQGSWYIKICSRPGWGRCCLGSREAGPRPRRWRWEDAPLLSQTGPLLIDDTYLKLSLSRERERERERLEKICHWELPTLSLLSVHNNSGKVGRVLIFCTLSVHDSGLKSEEKAGKDAVNLITMSRGLEIRNPMRFYPILLAADTNFAPFKS